MLPFWSSCVLNLFASIMYLITLSTISVTFFSTLQYIYFWWLYSNDYVGIRHFASSFELFTLCVWLIMLVRTLKTGGKCLPQISGAWHCIITTYESVPQKGVQHAHVFVIGREKDLLRVYCDINCKGLQFFVLKLLRHSMHFLFTLRVRGFHYHLIFHNL